MTGFTAPLSVKDGRLFFEGVDCSAVARAKGACFLYSPAAAAARFNRFRKAAGKALGNVVVAYAWKCNPVLGKVLAARGEWLALLSESDLAEAGEKRRNLFFSATVVRDWQRVLRSKAVVDVCSFPQLQAVEWLARKSGRKRKASIRVDLGVKTGACLDAFNGFNGFTTTEARELLSRKREWADVIGVHVHIGSQVEKLAAWRRAGKAVARLVEGRKLDFINLGGGYPVSYGKPVPELEKVLEMLKPAAEAAREQNRAATVFLEPGRWVAAPAGVLLANVLEKRKKGSVECLVLDASVYTAAMDTLIANTVLPAVAAGAPLAKASRKYDLKGGSACSQDFFARHAGLAPVQVGDVVVFENAGAYTRVLATEFGGAPVPKEYLVGLKGKMVVA